LPSKVLAPANFENHKFVKTNCAKLLDNGFSIGAKIMLTKRITVEFGPRKFRKDLSKGVVGFIAGIVDDWPVVEFSTIVDKKEIKADVKIKFENIKKFDGTAETSLDDVASSSIGKSAKSSLGNDFKFLHTDDDDEATTIEVIKKWEKLQCEHDPKYQALAMQSVMSFEMMCVSEVVPTLTEKDVVICKRGETYEVWARRDFKPWELAIAPLTNEFKDRFWSYTKSTIVKDSEQLNKYFTGSDKKIVCDGRLRSTISSSRSFGLFWMVARAADAKHANLEMKDLAIKISVELTLPGKRKTESAFKCPTPQLMVLTNPKAIPKHTMLVACEEKGLKALSDKVTAEVMKEKEKEKEKKLKAKDAEEDDV
jgi:hypothetical protein